MGPIFLNAVHARKWRQPAPNRERRIAGCVGPSRGDRNMPDDGWFAVQTRSRREQVAAHLLTEKGYECFLPTYAQRQTVRHRFVEKEMPLFPGYLFCRITAATTGKLITTPAVLGIVSFAGKRALVSDREIADLKLVISSGLPREPISCLLPGTRVRIQGGPLEGAEGVVEMCHPQGRFVVSVSLLQRSVAVLFDADVLAAMIADSPSRTAA